MVNEEIYGEESRDDSSPIAQSEVPQTDFNAEEIYDSLLPARMKPFADELLSSWMMRLAMAHGLKLESFCALVFGRKKALWNRDPDKSVTRMTLDLLAARTGCSYEEVYRTTLASYAGEMYEHHNSKGNTAWLMPIGIYHRKRFLSGLQFCPECLAGDVEPYYRRLWRVSWACVCVKHRIYLLDRCPHCRQPVNFHRDEMGIRNKHVADSMIICAHCLCDLTASRNAEFSCERIKANQTCGNEPSESLIRFQAKLEQTLCEGWFDMCDGKAIYGIAFFNGFRQLLSVLVKNGRTRTTLKTAVEHARGFVFDNTTNDTIDKCDLSPATGEAATRTGINFDRLPTRTRRDAVEAAAWLLDDWSKRLTDICRPHRIWSSTLLRDCENAPFWYFQPIYWELYRPSYQPSDDEVMSAIRYLEGRGGFCLPHQVSRLLGKTDVFAKRDAEFCTNAFERMKDYNERNFPICRAQVRADLVNEAIKNGKTYKEIAASYGCSFDLVANLVAERRHSNRENVSNTIRPLLERMKILPLKDA